MGYITMNQKELEQAKIFEQVMIGRITKREAAAKLRMTERWVRVKYKRYSQLKEFGLIHKSRGRASSNKWISSEKDLLISLLQGEWHDFGPTFAMEKLQEIYNIKVSKETVRTEMIKAGLWRAKVARVKHRKRRERKLIVGIMIQLDGSPHDWFEGRGAPCTLLVFIDDATSEILWLEFANGESVQALMQATKNYIEQFGIPQSFYTDYGSVFHVNLNNADGYKKTQWESACERIGITVIHANSPQAKGRVERCNQTMQDRLIKEMRLAGIDSIESANVFLRTSDFIAKHNQKFAVKAAHEGDAHASTEFYDLDDVFTIRNTRVLMNDFTIQYEKQIFQLHAKQRTILRPKDKITIKTHLNGDIELWIRRTQLSFNLLQARPKKPAKEKIVAPYRHQKPCNNSRRWASGIPPKESRVKPAAPAVEAIK